jgi:DNA-directed RNA polymerase subunit M/transcription elongation factor TFIIS
MENLRKITLETFQNITNEEIGTRLEQNLYDSIVTSDWQKAILKQSYKSKRDSFIKNWNKEDSRLKTLITQGMIENPFLMSAWEWDLKSNEEDFEKIQIAKDQWEKEFDGSKCPKCGENKMISTSKQERASDEGYTHRYYCYNCGYKSKQNT